MLVILLLIIMLVVTSDIWGAVRFVAYVVWLMWICGAILSVALQVYFWFENWIWPRPQQERIRVRNLAELMNLMVRIQMIEALDQMQE